MQGTTVPGLKVWDPKERVVWVPKLCVSMILPTRGILDRGHTAIEKNSLEHASRKLSTNLIGSPLRLRV